MVLLMITLSDLKRYDLFTALYICYATDTLTLVRCVKIAKRIELVLLKIVFNKKDGYRQQNVRQPQKLISIIDYDVCIFEYLQPFWRYSTSKNGLTFKSGHGVLQGH